MGLLKLGYSMFRDVLWCFMGFFYDVFTGFFNGVLWVFVVNLAFCLAKITGI